MTLTYCINYIKSDLSLFRQRSATPLPLEKRTKRKECEHGSRIESASESSRPHSKTLLVSKVQVCGMGVSTGRAPRILPLRNHQ